MRQLRLLIIIPLLVAVVSCSSKDEAIYNHQFFAFGTLIEVTVYGVDPALAERASDTLEEYFLAMHSDWHAWLPGSLTETNERLGTLEPFTANPDILPLLEEANRLSRLSSGLFNPVIGKLIAMWGFQDNALPIGELPDENDIQILVKQAPSAGDILIEGDRITSTNKAAQYDLGAFAKGYAIDKAIDRLRELGINNAIVNAGGDLRAIGQHGDRPWRIGIRHPRAGGILASIEIEGDTSIFTSGDYERFFEVDGVRYHHIIDPRTGYPASDTTSVTVVHHSAATADAAATALFVAGPENWIDTARHMNTNTVMLIDSNNVIHMTPAMQSLIQLEPGISAELKLSETTP
jgi:thiamine biosynthesis lipoprotein